MTYTLPKSEPEKTIDYSGVPLSVVYSNNMSRIIKAKVESKVHVEHQKIFSQGSTEQDVDTLCYDSDGQ